MIRLLSVQPDEVAAVERENGPSLLDGEVENGLVREPLIALLQLLERHDVVSEGAELLGDRAREVLVREQAGLSSGGLVVMDLPLDLVPVGVVVAPSAHQVFGAQRRKAAQQLRLGCAELAGTHQRVQTGIRVRTMQGSPPATAGSLSIPWRESPRSRTIHSSTRTFSVGLSAASACWAFSSSVIVRSATSRSQRPAAHTSVYDSGRALAGDGPAEGGEAAQPVDQPVQPPSDEGYQPSFQ